jgi:hypothetical protein
MDWKGIRRVPAIDRSGPRGEGLACGGEDQTGVHRGWGVRALARNCSVKDYRVPSLIRNSAPLGPYSRALPRALW